MPVVRNTILNFFGALIPLTVTLSTIPLYLKAIGPERYGVMALWWLALNYAVLFDCGFGRALAQRIGRLGSDASQQKANLLIVAFTFAMPIGVFGGLILSWVIRSYFAHVAILSPAVAAEIPGAMPMVLLSVPLVLALSLCRGFLQGNQSFWSLNILTVATSTMVQIIPLVTALQFGDSVVGLTTALTIAFAIAALFGLLLCMPNCRLRGERAQFLASFFSLFNFGKWVTVSATVGPLMVIADRFALAAFVSTAAAGLYAIPFQVAQRLTLFPAALTNALFPKIAGIASASARETSARAEYLLAWALSPVFVLLIVGVHPFLDLWLGQESSNLLRYVGEVLLLAFWFNSLAYISNNHITAIGAPRTVALVHLLELPIYSIALLFALPRFGILGAAVVFLARTLVDYMILRYFADFNSQGLLRLLLISVPLVVLTLATTAFADILEKRLSILPITVMFTVFWNSILVPSSERQYFLRILKRLSVRAK
ncbi:MAG: hypothetical protein AAF749_06895 [Pseudomonadota bacterium]